MFHTHMLDNVIIILSYRKEYANFDDLTDEGEEYLAGYIRDLVDCNRRRRVIREYLRREFDIDWG